MKTLVASVGLAALGTSGLQAQQLMSPSTDPARPWSASAALRGFYDDNINTSRDNKQDAVGFQISPSLSLITRWMEQTTILAVYEYSFKWYDNKPAGNSENYDQTQIFEFDLKHAFSSRYSLSVRDSFAMGQEPDLLRAGNSFSSFQRVSGNNFRNYGSIDFNAQLTREFGLDVGYINTLIKYEDDNGNFTNPSQAGLLNRLDNAVHIDALWVLQPQTTGIVGYQFKQVNYTAGESIGQLQDGTIIFSDNRDDRENYLYLGANQTFSPNLSGTMRLGARFINYYNEPPGSGIGNSVGPYVMLNLQYSYAPESYLEAGFSLDDNATDAFSVSGDSFTQNETSAVLHASVTHRITPKLFGSVVALFQDSMFNGGSLNNETERYYLLGLNLKYRFTQHFSAEVGYNYDDVASDDSIRSYNRNRVYVGVTAAY